MLSVSLLIRHLRCHLLRWRRLSLVPPTDLDFRKIPNQCTAQTQDSPLYGGGHEIDAPFIQQNKRISHGLFLYYRVRYIIASLREGGCAACGVGRRMRAVTHRTPSVASRQLPLQVGGAFHGMPRTVFHLGKTYIMEHFGWCPPAVGLRSSAAADSLHLGSVPI